MKTAVLIATMMILSVSCSTNSLNNCKGDGCKERIPSATQHEIPDFALGN